MATRGIDIRQSVTRIVFRVSLKSSAGAKIIAGTTELRVYRLNDDGTLDVFDWTTNAFVAPGSGTPDDETTMTHRQRRDSTGADVDTGIWTAVLTTLTNFTKGQVYIAQVTNSTATPESQEREFQFGSAVDDVAANLERASKCIVHGTVGSGSTSTNIVTSSLDPAAIEAGQFKGLIVAFDKDTTTTALRGQKVPIENSTSGGQLSIHPDNALTEAPVSGDTLVIE